ncbi:YqeG family HAD IIIA-type phosphatase [Sporosarcina sp. FSL K6-3457]|uniref:YqeG family HAD IIIA-type phosphatase n=1 Tax=Sporosarcina sp. FSL K6-3457 TaxID=2978204 RepID=UPI0030F8D0D9
MYNNFLPGEYVKSVFHIQPEKLVARGVKGIITDLDNTLVEWDRPHATAEIIDWVTSMRDVGIQVMIVSNNNNVRVKAFCDPLGIPFICEARKPLKKSFNKALTTMGIQKEQAVFIGDQMMTDILGGNRAGLHTILVVPVANSDGFFTKFNRMMERRIMANLKRKGLLKWEE